MALYRFAGLYFEMNPHFDRIKRQAEKYLYKGDVIPDEIFDIDIPYERIVRNSVHYPGLTYEECEYLGSGHRFACRLVSKDGFVLHSSAVAYDGNAYLFSADPGVGKSTHTKFWQECFGEDKAVIINDDKPAVREFDGVFCASGTPFSGKYDISADVTVPVKAVCFIHRSDECEIRRLEPSEALGLIIRQIINPDEEEALDTLFKTLDRFLAKVPVYSLGVKLSPESARFAYSELSKQA